MNYRWLLDCNPVLLALFAGLFTWGITALGSSMVFFFKEIKSKIFNSMLGFAAGIMIAASFWSLLLPAIEMSEQQGNVAWLPASIGFLAGGAFLLLIDKILPHLHFGLPTNKAEGIKTSWQRSTLLVLAITLHNIPEGLAIGIAFGALENSPNIGTLTSAITLAIGIGLQNFPEGTAVSVPLRREGLSRLKAFHYGQLSGIVEPVSAILGAYLILTITPILPYALSFAAGAMIFVVVEELIPESQSGNETDYSASGVMIGFVIMMILDIALS